MRSELEMFDLILTVASDDDLIRTVILNGSRANPNAAPDIFQDFDIIYLATELALLLTTPNGSNALVS